MSEINRPQGTDRRAIPQRSTGWDAKLADAMYAAKLTPNKVSVGSVIFALIGAAGLIVSGLVTTDAARAAWLMVTVVCIPLRLLLNMLDGMLAVEKGLHTPPGICSMRYPIALPIWYYLLPPGMRPPGSGRSVRRTGVLPWLVGCCRSDPHRICADPGCRQRGGGNFGSDGQARAYVGVGPGKSGPHYLNHF